MTDRSENNSTTPNGEERETGALPTSEDILREVLASEAAGVVRDADIADELSIDIYDESGTIDLDAAALPLPMDLRLAGRVIPPPSVPVAVSRVITNMLAQQGWHIFWWGGHAYAYHPGSSGMYTPLRQEDDDLAISAMLYSALEPARFVPDNDAGDGDDPGVPWNPTPKNVSDVLKTLKARSLLSDSRGINFWFGRKERERIRESLIERYPGSDIGRCFDEALRPRAVREVPAIFINTRSGILWCRYESVGDAWEGDGAPRRIMLPHTPGFFTTMVVDCEYDPDAADGWGGGGEPSRWLDLVESMFDDPDGHVTLREWYGYLVSGRKDLEKMLFIIGPTRSGKGVVAETMETQMGGSEHVLSTSFTKLSGNDFSLETALGKRLILIPDAEITSVSGGLRSILLSLTSVDTMGINRKFKTQRDVKLPGLVVIVANEMPKINDPSGALAERMLILRTRATVEKSRRDPGLKHYLTTHEMTGILHWALDGLDRVMLPGATFTESEVMEDHVEDERERMAGPVYQFARECLVFEESGRMNLQALHETWKDWVLRNDIPRVDLDARYVTGRLKLLGYPIIDRKKTVRHPVTRVGGPGAWGLRFKTDDERELELREGLEGM